MKQKIYKGKKHIQAMAARALDPGEYIASRRRWGSQDRPQLGMRDAGSWLLSPDLGCGHRSRPVRAQDPDGGHRLGASLAGIPPAARAPGTPRRARAPPAWRPRREGLRRRHLGAVKEVGEGDSGDLGAASAPLRHHPEQEVPRCWLAAALTADAGSQLRHRSQSVRGRRPTQMGRRHTPAAGSLDAAPARCTAWGDFDLVLDSGWIQRRRSPELERRCSPLAVDLVCLPRRAPASSPLTSSWTRETHETLTSAPSASVTGRCNGVMLILPHQHLQQAPS